MSHKNRLKISHRRHTGHLRSHEYTSYVPLFILLVVVGIILVIDSAYALSEQGTKANPPPPIGESVGLSGTMPGHPPKTAAIITSPTNGTSLADSPTEVSGICPADTLVEIYDNDIFAGSTTCKSGRFSLKIGLMLGKNQLIARVYNAVNQEGPQSATVSVSYSVAAGVSSALAPLDLGGKQLIINTSAVFRGTFPGQDLNVPVTIIGGTPPYALNIDWGDSSNKVISRDNNITFSVDHIYQKPGTFQITLQATDKNGRVAFLTVAAIVNGQPPVAASNSSNNGNGPSSAILELWPLYTASAAVVISFWMGERRERRLLAAHPSLILHASH